MALAFRILYILVAVSFVLSEMPNISFRFIYNAAPPAIACAALLPLSAGLFIVIEKWGERITGYRMSPDRRWLIPLPAMLALASIVEGIVTPIGGYGTGTRLEFYVEVMLVSVGLLPFLLLEEVRTPIGFILGVWACYGAWLAALMLVFYKLRDRLY